MRGTILDDSGMSRRSTARRLTNAVFFTRARPPVTWPVAQRYLATKSSDAAYPNWSSICLLLASAFLTTGVARAESYATNWLTAVQLYQAYADQPMSVDRAVQLATHDPGDERPNGHFNPAANRDIYAQKVQVASLPRTGADYLRLSLSVSPNGYDPKHGEMRTGLAAGNELILGKATYSSPWQQTPFYSTLHVLIDANDLANIPIAEDLFRRIALTGPAKAVVAALVIGGRVERRQVATAYYENRNEFNGLPDTQAGVLYVYLVKVRPISIQITTPSGTLSFSSEQIPSSGGGSVAPPDQRLDWLNELKKPLAPPLKPKKSPSLLESRQLAEVLLDAAKAGDLTTLDQALQEGAYPMISDQVNGGNALTWAITGMGQKKISPVRQLEVIDSLLRYGVDPNGTPERFPLGMVRDGHAAILLVRAGADPNKRYSDGKTLLMRAAGDGNLDVVRVLLAAGADAGAQVPRSATEAARNPLTAENFADAAGQKPVVRLLRDFSQNGKTALAWPMTASSEEEATATQPIASFTPAGQAPPVLKGLPASN